MNITNLGEIGAVGGALTPITLTLERDGIVWNLTGYTAPELRVWDLRTKTLKALTGSAVITAPETNGEVTYTPGAADPLFSESGIFEARVWVTSGGKKQPSGLFRFSIGAGPTPS